MKCFACGKEKDTIRLTYPKMEYDLCEECATFHFLHNQLAKMVR